LERERERGRERVEVNRKKKKKKKKMLVKKSSTGLWQVDKSKFDKKSEIILQDYILGHDVDIMNRLFYNPKSFQKKLIPAQIISVENFYEEDEPMYDIVRNSLKACLREDIPDNFIIFAELCLLADHAPTKHMFIKNANERKLCQFMGFLKEQQTIFFMSCIQECNAIPLLNNFIKVVKNAYLSYDIIMFMEFGKLASEQRAEDELLQINEHEFVPGLQPDFEEVLRSADIEYCKGILIDEHISAPEEHKGKNFQSILDPKPKISYDKDSIVHYNITHYLLLTLLLIQKNIVI
jgi:hypothetical protein